MSAVASSLRGVGRLRLPRIDVRVVTGILLVAVSVVGGLRLSVGPAPATRVWVAADDLDAGHVLTRGDLAQAGVRGPASFVAGFEPVSGRPPVGQVLRTAVRAGAPFEAGAFGPVEPAGRELTVPVTPEHALGGALRVGDRVDVLGSFDKGTDAARTLTVARDAVVRGVTRSDGLFGQREGSLTAVTVTVAPDSAVALAFAARNGEIDVVRARGALDVTARARFDADSLR
jgi:Flp pilus assembly protein CpaB